MKLQNLERLKANDPTLVTWKECDQQWDHNVFVSIAEYLATNTHLKRLDFTKLSIGDEEARLLALAICQNLTLETLNLQNNLIHNEGAKAIALAIFHNPMIQNLCLGINEIESEGVRSLAAAFSQNRTLVSIDLEWNPLGSVGVECIASGLLQNQTVRDLSLAYTEMGDTGALAMAVLLTQPHNKIEWLDLEGNTIDFEGCKALAYALKRNRSLGWLRLENNGIIEPSIDAFKQALHFNTTFHTLEIDEDRDDGSIFKLVETNRARRKICRLIQTILYGIRTRRERGTILHTQPKEIVRLICETLWKHHYHDEAWDDLEEVWSEDGQRSRYFHCGEELEEF